MTYPVLGARSMVHCPMCRYALDRHDLESALGCDVSVWRLAQTERRCKSLRQLTDGCTPLAMGSTEPVSRVVARLVQDCNEMTADDGFVYNVAVLAIERSLFHRSNFVRSLAIQLQARRNHSQDAIEFIKENLACHVDVLIRTSNSVQEG